MTAPVMSELSNLGVDRLLVGDPPTTWVVLLLGGGQIPNI